MYLRLFFHLLLVGISHKSGFYHLPQITSLFHCKIYAQVFSFKLRGAYNMMANLSREQLARGVICSSAGNHAQGVALAARRLKCDAVIAMPVTTPEIKVGLAADESSLCFSNHLEC